MICSETALRGLLTSGPGPGPGPGRGLLEHWSRVASEYDCLGKHLLNDQRTINYHYYGLSYFTDFN